MIRLTIDDDCLQEEALAWWRSLDPGTRAVFLQATWECEDCPEPRVRGKKAEEDTPQ
jgi:hypothetical protein